MQKQSQPPRFRRLPQRETASAKPLAIAVILIIAISVFFYLKNLDRQKQILKKEQVANEQEKRDENLQVPTISSEETAKAIRNEKFQLVDMREKDEFVLKHIESSINIPLSELESKIQLLSKEKTIIFIDREESRNGKILVEHLDKEGLDIKYLEGGIIRYAHEGFNLVSVGNPLIQEDLLKVSSFSAKELIDKLMNGESLKFIDTRTEVDFAIEHLNGSINIPLEDIEKKKDSLPIRTFVVFDKDPIRSFQAAVRLYEMDVIGVYNCTDDYATFKNIIDNLGNEEIVDQESSTSEEN